MEPGFRRCSVWRALVAALVMRALPVLLALALFGCSERADDARKAELASVFSRADQPLIRARPALVAGKYARMASSPFDFFRGSLPLYVHDTRRGGSFAGFAVRRPCRNARQRYGYTCGAR